RRREDEVGAGPPAHLQVGVEGARIAVEVLVRPELQRIHEDRHQYVVGLLPGGAQQRLVAGVQGAHGHHHADGALQRRPGLGQLGARVDKLRHAATSRLVPASTPSSGWASTGRRRPAAIARSAVRRASARYAGTDSGAVAASRARCRSTVPASPRDTGPVSASSPRRNAFSRAARSRGASTFSGRATPASRSRSVASFTRVTRWFAPCASAAWYSGRSPSATHSGTPPRS